MISVRYKKLNEAQDLKDFSGYAVDVEGNVWSLRRKWAKKLKPFPMKNGHLFVKLLDDNNQRFTYYVHRLVALAFLPTDNTSRGVTHKNKNLNDNRLENIEWIVPKRSIEEADDFILKKEIIQRIQQVHIAAQKKGIKVGNSYDFTTHLVENAIDAYIMQYGLRKVMN